MEVLRHDWNFVPFHTTTETIRSCKKQLREGGSVDGLKTSVARTSSPNNNNREDVIRGPGFGDGQVAIRPQNDLFPLSLQFQRRTYDDVEGTGSVDGLNVNSLRPVPQTTLKMTDGAGNVRRCIMKKIKGKEIRKCRR